MTHRELVIAALNHKEPDRVPLDVWGSASRSGSYVNERVEVLLDSDFRHLHIGHPCNFKHWVNESGDRMSEWGYGSRDIAGHLTVTWFPLAAAEAGDINRHPWPKAEDPGRIEGLAAEAKRLRETTDCFLPVRVVFGPGEVKRAGAEAKAFGRTAFVVPYKEHGFFQGLLDGVCAGLKAAGRPAEEVAEEWMNGVGVPTRLTQVGIPEKDVAKLADEVQRVSFGPDGRLGARVPATRADVEAILRLAL